MDKKEVFYPIQVEFWIFSDLGVVVGFAFEDGEGAVELFGEEEAYHLVGEGHLGDGLLLLGYRHVPRVLQGRNHLAFLGNMVFEPFLKNGDAILEVGFFRLAVL